MSADRPEDSADRQSSPIALEAYEALAEGFARIADSNVYNGKYDRPNTVALIPEVNGKRVLDAGCGPGWYSQWLMERGAEVTGVDISPAMLAQARTRLGKQVELVRADLERQLPFADRAFDVIVAGLVLEYVRDWHAAMREFHRVLRRGGTLVFSCQHPMADYLRHPETDYYDVALVEYPWRTFGETVTVPYYRRSFSEVVGSVIESGFCLERMGEPRPSEEIGRSDPKSFEKLSQYPHFLWVRARKG